MQRLFKGRLAFRLNLQLFADGGGAAAGGDGGTGADGGNGVSAGVPSLPQTKGAKSNPLANVQYGIQDSSPQDAAAVNTEERTARFDELIKGEYKDLYDAKVQDIIQRRLKSTKETVEKFEALSPTLDLLARKYGVDATDVEALNKAIEEDDSYFEDEALEKGLSVEQLKEIRKMERENAELRRQMEEQSVRENADRIYAQWMQQADEVKKVYPVFDLNEELQNPRFTDLIRNNIDLRTAYEVIHKDDIIPAAMQFAVADTSKKLTNKILSNGARPLENGLASQASVITKSDVSQLSKADRQEIIRRVQRGEKIRF